MLDGRAKPRSGAVEESRSSSASSFSIDNDIPEDSGTALLLRQSVTNGAGEASGLGIQQMLRQNSEFQRMQREVDADGAGSAASPNAASPVEPMEGLFSTKSLRAGEGSNAALAGTIQNMAAQQLSSPKRSAAASHVTASRASSSNVRVSSGLDSDMLNSTCTSDVDPRVLDRTSAGRNPQHDTRYEDDEFDAEEEENDAAESSTRAQEFEADEAAIDLHVRKTKHGIELRRQRDEVEEEEYQRRREIEDEQRMQGWIGDGGIAAAFEDFHQQTDIMEDEHESRHALDVQERSLSLALWSVMVEEQATRDCNRIMLEEQVDRVAAEAVAASTLSEHLALFQMVVLQIDLCGNEAVSRASIVDDEAAAYAQVSEAQVLGSKDAHWRQDARQAASAVLFGAEASSRGVVASHQLDEHLTLDDMTTAFFAIASQEAVAFAELVRAEHRGKLEAQCTTLVRGILAELEALETIEPAARKTISTAEWEARRPMYEEHRKRFLLFRPRKPPVPRAPRRAFIPRVPPTKPAVLEPAAQPQRAAADGVAYTRPTIRKVKPLPLKKLPPFADVAAEAAQHKMYGRLCATLVDESVGRKSVATREQQQWITLMGACHSAAQDVAATTASDARTTHSNHQPFRVSHLDRGRYYEFREEAKLRRVQNEERSRLQTLVARLIAVDMAFEAKAAVGMGKHRATAVREVRPPFNCGDSQTWAKLCRLGVADNRDASPARSPTTSGNRCSQQPPTARPATATTHAARPPAAPRPVHSARPAARESFQDALDRSLDEALGLRSPPTNCATDQISASGTEQPRVLDLPPSPSSSSSRPSSSMSTSRSTSPAASRREDSYCSERAPLASTGHCQSSRDSITQVHQNSEYADESFYSSVASPHRRQGEDGVALNDTVRCSEADDEEAPSLPTEGSAPQPIRDSPPKEEVVHSLIRDPVPRSSPPRRENDAPISRHDDARLSRSSSSSSSRSGRGSSNSSEDSWHPMATA